MAPSVRPYRGDDYAQVIDLYQQSDLYGGQFDPDRDGPERIAAQASHFAGAVLVAETGGRLVGTVSLIEDGRVAWLFRFAVAQDANEIQVARALYAHAIDALHQRGHRQVLVYAPTGAEHLARRYDEIGMQQGGDYTCFWSEI